MQRLLLTIFILLAAALPLVANTRSAAEPDHFPVVVLAGLSLLALWFAVRDYYVSE